MQISQDQKIVSQVLNEAWSNPAFKEELIASPIEAIKKLTGFTFQLPEGVERFEVVDQTNPSVLHINIPAEPNMEDVELSEAQLEVVAGGGSILPNPIDILIPTLPPCFPFPGGTGPYNPYPESTF